MIDDHSDGIPVPVWLISENPDGNTSLLQIKILNFICHT